MHEETASDLNIKYDGTYIGVHFEGNNYLGLIRNFYQDADSYNDIRFDITIRGNAGHWSSNTSYWYKRESSLLLEYPLMGAVNVDDSVIVFKRKLKLDSPSRYRKALRKDSFRWFDPNLLEREILGLTLTNYSNTDLLNNVGKDLFFRKEMTSEEALSSILDNKRIGAAFDEHYYYTLNSCNNTIALWRADNIIGNYNFDNSKFELNTDLFKSDLVNLGVKL